MASHLGKSYTKRGSRLLFVPRTSNCVKEEENRSIKLNACLWFLCLHTSFNHSAITYIYNILNTYMIYVYRMYVHIHISSICIHNMSDGAEWRTLYHLKRTAETGAQNSDRRGTKTWRLAYKSLLEIASHPCPLSVPTFLWLWFLTSLSTGRGISLRFYFRPRVCFLFLSHMFPVPHVSQQICLLFLLFICIGP